MKLRPTPLHGWWKPLLACWAAGVLNAAGADANLGGATLSSNTASTARTTILQRAEPQPLTAIDWDAFQAEWTAFDHTPFNASGFNPVVLPFQCAADAATGAPEESLAFSFLLSWALDWVPGSYCSRHAYFIFKRSGADVIRAGRTLDASLLPALAERWSATHVIGGTLSRTGDQFTASVKVFDAGGALIDQSEISEPHDYFALVGQVSAAVMRAIGYEPSAALIAHLSAPRCRDRQSIIELGKAAFAEERSAQEFSLYRNILDRDPDFAEVRFWATNQGYWKHLNWNALQEQEFKALQTYLMISGLDSYRIRSTHPAEVRRQFEKMIDHAAELTAPDLPQVLTSRLRLAYWEDSVSAELLETALAAARRYPNNATLLMNLEAITVPQRVWYSAGDMDLTVSLVLAQLGSRYMASGSSQIHYAMRKVAQALLFGGRHHDAAVILTGLLSIPSVRQDTDSFSRCTLLLAEALRQLGHHAEALTTLNALLETQGDSTSGWHAAGACMLAALSGNRVAFEDLMARHRTVIEKDGFDRICGWYRKLLEGETEVEEDAYHALAKSPSGPAYAQALAALASLDLQAGRTRCRTRVEKCLQVFPYDREMWILYDAYETKSSRPEARFFYDFLAAHDPRDPWIQSAVARYRKKNPTSQAADIQAVENLLAAYRPVRWPTLHPRPERIRATKLVCPFTLAAVVRQLQAEKRYEQADELVLRFLHYTTSLSHPAAKSELGEGLRIFANHLLHQTERARRARSDTPRGSVDQMASAQTHPADGDHTEPLR